MLTLISNLIFNVCMCQSDEYRAVEILQYKYKKLVIVTYFETELKLNNKYSCLKEVRAFKEGSSYQITGSFRFHATKVSLSVYRCIA